MSCDAGEEELRGDGKNALRCTCDGVRETVPKPCIDGMREICDENGTAEAAGEVCEYSDCGCELRFDAF